MKYLILGLMFLLSISQARSDDWKIEVGDKLLASLFYIPGTQPTVRANVEIDIMSQNPDGKSFSVEAYITSFSAYAGNDIVYSFQADPKRKIYTFKAKAILSKSEDEWEIAILPPIISDSEGALDVSQFSISKFTTKINEESDSLNDGVRVLTQVVFQERLYNSTCRLWFFNKNHK